MLALHFDSMDLEPDVHGGTPGAKGVWFVHVGARSFTSPFGKVRPGKVDLGSCRRARVGARS